VATKKLPVLVAVDFSPDSEAALVWAADFARKMSAPLEVVHVVHDPADEPGFYRRKETDSLLPMEDVAREMAEEFMKKAAKDYPDRASLKKADVVIVTGVPETRILELVQKHDARHIVLGCRGLTGLDRLMLGSIADYVVQNSPVPVTVVKAEAPVKGGETDDQNEE